MAQKFNPLLKLGLQEIGKDYSSNISALQNAINSLQSQANALQTALNTLKGNKITKCFTAADLAELDDNEIFEWQGASGTVNETAFVNGYFYKKTFLPATVQVLILYHNYAYINGEYLADTYYFSYSEDPGLTQYNSSRNIDNKSVVWIGNSTPNVGDLVTISIGESSQSFVTITNKEIVDLQFQYTDSNGDVWSLNSSSVYSRAITYNYYTNSQGVTINVNWNEFFDNMGFVCSDNGKLYLVRWTNYGSTGAQFDTVVNPEGSATYTQTNTQPESSYTLPKATSNLLGGVVIGEYLDNSNALTLDFTLFGTGDDEMPDVNDDYFEVEIGTLWFHIFVFKVVCSDNFSTKSHRIILPFNFVCDFGGYIYDENLVCIGHYTLSGNVLTIYKTDISTDFSLMDGFTFIAFR